ncbi:unnamed protein product [Lampetra planeri]
MRNKSNIQHMHHEHHQQQQQQQHQQQRPTINSLLEERPGKECVCRTRAWLSNHGALPSFALLARSPLSLSGGAKRKSCEMCLSASELRVPVARR